jgi:hypothetical protein
MSESEKAAESKEETKAAASKREAEEKKAAEEQAKQDEADIETFLAYHRGQDLVRGENGSVDLPAYVALREAAKAEED